MKGDSKEQLLSKLPEQKKFILLGDVMLGRGVNELIRESPPGYAWGDTLEIIKSADYSLVNLECALTYHEKNWAKTPKAYYFRADPGVAIACLKAANISCACIANNHILDFQEEGLVDTLNFLDKAGICHAGAGRNLPEARDPAYRAIGDTRVGLIAFTDNEPAFAAAEELSGVDYLPVYLDTEPFNSFLEAVFEAKRACDILIVSAHWGPNMEFRLPIEFREAAHRMIAAGADIIHGHSAHNFQGIEIYEGKPIFYATGDFIDDYAIDPIYRNDWTFIFVLNINGVEMDSIELYPVHISFAQAMLAKGIESTLIMDRMEAMCGELGTKTARQKDRISVPISEEQLRRAG